MPSVGTAPGAALACGTTLRVTNDMSMNTMALETRRTRGGRNSIGCPRIAAAPFRVVVRTRSAATATAMAMAGSVGP